MSEKVKVGDLFNVVVDGAIVPRLTVLRVIDQKENGYFELKPLNIYNDNILCPEKCLLGMAYQKITW